MTRSLTIPVRAVLTPDQEKELGQVIQSGITWRKGGEPALTPAALAARNTLVMHNAGLAISIIEQRGCSVGEFPDWFIYAMFGVITAANKFDPKRGYRFSTMATPWIRQAITRGIQTETTLIRVPSWVWEGASKRDKKLAANAGKELTDAQMANLFRSNSDPTLARQTLACAKSATTVASLDKKYGRGDGTPLGEWMPDPNSHPEQDIIRHDTAEKLRLAISRLSDQQAAIVQLHFFDELSYLKISKRLGLSYRVVQAEKTKAMVRLRRDPMVQGLG